MFKRFVLLASLTLILTACNMGATESATLTPSFTLTLEPSPTLTLTATPSATATEAITATPSITPTDAPTQTPTLEPSVTDTPTITPTPFNTPLPISAYNARPEWENFDVSPLIRDGLNRPHIAFLNENDSENVTSLATAAPGTDRAVIYFVDPANASNLYPIIELASSQLEQVWISPHGNSLAYLLNNRAGPTRRGLWYVDMVSGIGSKLLDTDTFTLRGLSNPPVWSPDGRQLAVTFETGYSLDIFAFNLNDVSWAGLVVDGSNNFWPAYSPDGHYLAFVSDRETCPTWDASVPEACDSATDAPPHGGNVYLIDLTTGVINGVSDSPTTEPPYWVNEHLLAFSGGDSFDLLNPSRTLWLADTRTMQAGQVRYVGSGSSALNVAEAWSPDGERVVFQDASGSDTQIVVTDASGTIIEVIDQIAFSRYAMAASWQPNGDRLALAGTSGQCPTTLRVLGGDFSVLLAPQRPTSACNPVYSPDGNTLAYTGLSTGTNTTNRVSDGRRDIYVISSTNNNSIPLTLDLRGQMTFLGWVSP